MTGALAEDPVMIPGLPPLIGCSPAMLVVRDRIARVARSTLPVLLIGPTGSGKEVVARHLHALSQRRGRLVDVNCGALPRDMIESLLFGHRRGAFTGALETTVGHIARADGGTLFLDELASLPQEGQAKLLRVLETGEVLPLGSGLAQRVDFRVVAAVQADIHDRVESGQFRDDLFHRVAGLTLHLPSLSTRPEDIEPLARYFASIRGRTLEPRALRVLEWQPWPGNVRQLRAVIERAMILREEPVLTEVAVRESLDHGHPGHDPGQAGARASLLALCANEGGNVDRIAQALGVSRATLYRRLKEHGIRLHLR